MRIAIAGAGSVGRSIAGELVENGHQVMLIDRDPEAIKPGRIEAAEWVLADACEVALLEDAGLQTCDVVIACTGDDKVNLVVSLLAKTEFAVGRVVGRVNDPRNEWLFTDAWGVDVAVSTPRILAALVEEAVTVGDLVRLFTLRQGQVEPGGGDAAADDQHRRPPGARPASCRGTRRWSPSCAAAGSSCRSRTSRSSPVTNCCSWRPPRWRTRSGKRCADAGSCRSAAVLGPRDEPAPPGELCPAAGPMARLHPATIHTEMAIATMNSGYPINSRTAASQPTWSLSYR